MMEAGTEVKMMNSSWRLEVVVTRSQCEETLAWRAGREVYVSSGVLVGRCSRKPKTDMLSALVRVREGYELGVGISALMRLLVVKFYLRGLKSCWRPQGEGVYCLDRYRRWRHGITVPE
jgi:hypothetical protein